MRYTEMTQAALRAEYDICLAQYRAYQAMGLSLNMSRGKPNAEQLALSGAMLGNLTPEDCFSEDGTDCRNYGGRDGLPEMKRLFAEILEVSPHEVIVGGNSSLAMMFDCVAAFIQPGEMGRTDGVSRIKFICPAPGYDRHFAICEYFGIEMIPVEMTPDGPDMDAVEALVSVDPLIAGMWCVPIFSNPQGFVYAEDTIRRLAAIKTACEHFKIFWDNAYAVHHFRGRHRRILNILRACEACGHADRPLLFTSFSKISFAGAAVAALAASDHNCALFQKRIAIRTVGPDKLNQLRHVRFFKDLTGVLAHMEKQAEIVRPKFERADALLTRQLEGTGIGEWHCPDGGYFLLFNTPYHCAKRTVALCREAGVEMTEAGATWPYKQDPLDRNIRVAPTYLSPEELEMALHVFCVAVRLAALEKYMEDSSRA